MTDAEKFQAWKSAHYPTSSRVHTQMMYAAWVAATSWNAPKDPPAPKPKTSRRSTSRTFEVGNE